MLKRFFLASMFLALLSLSAMIAVHVFSGERARTRVQGMQVLLEKERIASDLRMALERYRRHSAGFRKLTDPEVEKVKADLAARFRAGMERIGDPERTAGIRAAFEDLLQTGRRIEPRYFTRDAYQDVAYRAQHDALARMLEELGNQSAEAALRVPPELDRARSLSVRLLVTLAGFCALLGLLTLAGHQLFHGRPLLLLRRRLTEYESAQLSPPPPRHRPLRGAYGEIERTLRALSLAVASQRKERLAFLTSVVDDLKTPDPSRISRALDDLGDLVAIERSGLRLEDRIVDLTELLERVVEMAGGKASTHPVIFSAPAVRTWALADPSKLERAVFALLTKLRKISPPGTPLAISLGRAAKGEGAFRDAEIHVGERGAEHPSAGPAPREEGALHHWVHENGFGVALAHRIVEAHGGKLRVSGAPGSAFQFVVRIPEERIASGASLTAAAPASAPAFALGSWLEGGRLNPVLAKQAVNLRS